MLKRLLALFLLVSLMASVSGCTMLWGHDGGHPISQYLAEDKEQVSTGTFWSQRHFKTHWQIFFDGVNDMHQFFDRHFLNYDWNDPEYN